ncbi:MAG: NTP transferase domain-containing protein [Candidatus Kaelpia imicola]|nr:NTP transferase domain-containing protein [Candidatus Kaelpia imicola]
MKSICGLILAAGKGTRLKSSLPKYRHKIAGWSLLRHSIENLRGAGIDDIYVLAGFGESEFIDKNFSVSTIEQKRRTGTADALLIALKNIPKKYKTIVLLYVDVVLLKAKTIKSLLSKHNRDNSDITLLTMELDVPKGYGRVLSNESGNMVAVKEEDLLNKSEKKIKEVNVGVYIFKRKNSLERDLCSIKPKGDKKEKYLTEIFPIYNKRGLKVLALKLKDINEGLGINSRRELVEANKILYRRNADEHILKGVSILSPENTFIERDVAIGRDTVIYPFAYIGFGVRIGENCIIGPSCRIKGGSRIGNNVKVENFAEISHSEIDNNSKIKHFSYIGDASVGKSVNIGAGTVIANYDGRRKNKTVIKDNAFIGSNTTLVAPVEIGKGVITGAGSVVTKNSKIADNSVIVGVPAKILRRRRDG